MGTSEEHKRLLGLSRMVDDWAEEHLGGEPDWVPLEAVLPWEWCGGFMWMSRFEAGGVVIELYKHGITRRYLNLDHEGGAHRYTGSGYMPIPLNEAIGWVFEDIEKMGWLPSTTFDDEFIAEKYAALREAGFTVIATGPPSRTEPSRPPRSSKARRRGPTGE